MNRDEAFALVNETCHVEYHLAGHSGGKGWARISIERETTPTEALAVAREVFDELTGLADGYDVSSFRLSGLPEWLAVPTFPIA